MNMRTEHTDTDRRRFLKGLAAAGAAALPASTGDAAPERKKQYGMLLDTRRCVGCQACAVSCRSENDVPLGYERSWVEQIDKGSYPNTTVKFLPRLCNQCSEPQCVSVCPTGATYKRPEDGIVVVEADVCIGCKYCIQACPYDARYLNPKTGVADKCDFCANRLAQGRQPACVQTCFFRARIFGDLNDPNSEISRLIATNPVTVLRSEMGTMPNVFYIAAEHMGEADARHYGEYIRVTTRRSMNERR